MRNSPRQHAIRLYHLVPWWQHHEPTKHQLARNRILFWVPDKPDLFHADSGLRPNVPGSIRANNLLPSMRMTWNTFLLILVYRHYWLNRKYFLLSHFTWTSSNIEATQNKNIRLVTFQWQAGHISLFSHLALPWNSNGTNSRYQDEPSTTLCKAPAAFHYGFAGEVRLGDVTAKGRHTIGTHEWRRHQALTQHPS